MPASVVGTSPATDTTGVEESSNPIDGRTRRATAENMSVRARPDSPGVYEVGSASGATYLVELGLGPDPAPGGVGVTGAGEHPRGSTAAESCVCPDYEKRPSELGCKHLRRVKLDVATGELPHPEDWPSEASLAACELTRPGVEPSSRPPAVSTDGGVVHAGSGASRSPEVDGPRADESAGSAPAGSAPADDTEVTGTVVDPPEFVRRIGDRIEDIERELERRQAELEDLRTALAVLENLTSGGRR
jgi:hypothetical protein